MGTTVGTTVPSNRHRIVAVVGAMVTILGVLPALPALGVAPDTDVRTVLVSTFSASGAALGAAGATDDADAGWLVSPPLSAGDAVLVGADWGGAAGVEVEVRNRYDGVWGPWTPLVVHDDHAPDAGTAEAARIDTTATDPVWVGPSDELQLRQRGGRLPVELDLVEVSGGDGLAYEPSARPVFAPSAAAATVQPEILSRASWGADESRRTSPPRFADRARFAVVHHTAGSNSYSSSQADDVIRSIYAYHLKNGWSDIAYNFLIDRFGRIWEGRAGGITEPVIGGHAAGWNGGSIGISVLGHFDQVAPTQATLDALDQLTAWKLDLHHIDPHGTTDEISGSGSSNRYSAGDHVTLPTIIGHRHTNNTSCPGGLLYDHVAGRNGHAPLADRVDAIGHPKAYGGLPAHREQPQIGIRPRLDATFSQPVDWTAEIRNAAGEAVRAATGTGTEVQLAWDLRDGDGIDAQLVEPGTYIATVSGTGDEGQSTPITTTIEVTPPAERKRGATRVETAVELSEWAFETAGRIVVASAEAFPDALVASPLAGSLDAPVLLVPKDSVPAVVGDEIRRLGATTAHVIGGGARISEEVERQLSGLGVSTIVRYAGETRYHTAEQVARAVMVREKPTEALLALGDHPTAATAFSDALIAGAFGAHHAAPLVLTQPDRLPEPTARLLRDLRPRTVTVVSSAGAVPESVQEAATTAAGGAERQTIAGNDRYDTSQRAATETLDRWRTAAEEQGPNPYAVPTGLEIVVASGGNWPDALGAAAAADERGVPFLLVPPQRMADGPAAARFLDDHAYDLAHVVVSGGAKAVSDQVVDEIATIARSAGPHREAPEPWGPADGGQSVGDFLPPEQLALPPPKH